MRGVEFEPSDDSDGDVVVEWLSDSRTAQDAIPVFTAQVLGLSVPQLAEAAEEAGEWWLASLRWSASAFSSISQRECQSLPLLQSAAQALERWAAARESGWAGCC